ncbi:metal ABC transporter solute-binding protein, Zn/Mn family [Rubritepida flocculans]|uniref:metal ABC transporter solute-binding protein, Zn/Mn family n=1 Tax=Rubritepida flocculans TaxID=182403 RepID=UPI000414C26B|nr:zinc ABC transporter substrate-binding protein [Rubritepida flocculans]
MTPRRPLLALPLLALAPRRAAAQAGPPVVVASFSILGDLVQQVGGARIALRVIAGPGVDSHHFQPRPTDAQALREAALLVRNGLGFDAWFDRLARAAAGQRAAPMLTVTDGITPRSMEAHHHHHHHHHGGAERRTQHAAGPRRVADPHAWQDVRLAQHYVRAIAAGLARMDSAGAEAHQAAAEAFLRRLEALDAWIRAEIATVPPARRKVLTTHDAFGYFGDAYGVTFLAAQGVSAEAEPSAAAVARLIRQVRAENLTAVFLEGQGSQAVLERLAREAGVRVRGRLYADALSAPDGPAASYEAMMRHNVALMVAAMKEGA